jgi:TolA-binding protein
MRRYWIILALLFVAATTEENRLYRVAEAAFNDRLYDVAERQFAEFLDRFPKSDRADGAQLLLGEAQLNQGHAQEAMRSFQNGLAQWPDKRPDSFRFWLAEALVRNGKFPEAAARYQEVAEKFSRSAYRGQALYGLAFARFKQNQFDLASSALDQLKAMGPKGDLAQNAELLRGQVYLAQEKSAEADAIFNGIAKQFPNTLAAYRAFYWLGKSLAHRKQDDDALKAYATVTDAYKARPNKPVDPSLAAETWYAAGWVYWDTGKFDSAADAFSSAFADAQTAPLKREAMLKLSESYMRGGKLAESAAKLKEFLKAHPADPLADEVQMAIADLLFGHDEFAAALPEYTNLITNFSQSALLPKANFNAGWCAWKMDQVSDALKYFQQAFTLANDPAMASESLFKVADAQFALGQYANAVASYQQLIGTYPEAKLLDRAMFQLGEAYRQLRNAEASTATFESLLKLYPKSPLAPEAEFIIGQLAVGLGQEPAARAAFAEVVSRFPDTEWANKAALAIGESYYREGKYAQASAEFERLMANGLESPLAQEAFYNRGWCQAQTGQSEKTNAEFADFLARYPQSAFAADIQFWMGDYYQKQKNYVKAQEQFQLLAEKYPTSKLADHAQYLAGQAAYARQDYQAAIDLFEGLALPKKFPDSTLRCDARFAEGDALTELGRFDDALLVFDSLVKTFSSCYLVCEAQGRRGDCQFTLNRFDDALASYRKALDCAQDPTARDHALYNVGQCYQKQDKSEDALQYYTKALYEAAVTPNTNEPPERFWAGKAGVAAADIKEKQEQWRDAITLYQKLMGICPELKPLAEDRIRKIRVEHFTWF